MKCLDTTFLIDFLRGKTPFCELPPNIYCTTQINVYELFFGIHRIESGHKEKRLESAEGLLQQITVLPFSDIATRKAAEITASLMSKGLDIGQNDGITAAIALSNNITIIVTKDIEHFKRIPGISVEKY